MKVKRIVANIETADVTKAEHFYRDILGLDLIMDLDWVRTYGSGSPTAVQISFAAEGGSGTSVPDISIEVDDLDAALQKFEQASVRIEYGPVKEPWGIRRFFVRDPFGKLINILQHD